MPISANGWRLLSLLHLLIPALTQVAVKQRRKSKTAPQRQKETGFLTSKSMRDVREFQKRLHRADLDFARNLLELFDGVREMKQGSDDPQKVEEGRIRLETMEKGVYREGTGWIWNGHIVPPPHSTDAFFERRKRIIANGIWNPDRKGWEH